MKIVHMSDLHFGTEEPHIVDNLLDALRRITPDLTVISGDFTQIGSRAEFKMARAFLESVPAETLCIPGNHDVPSRNLAKRFIEPFGRYRRYIGEELDVVYENDAVVIAGINSARRALLHWNWANGAVSEEQREFLQKTFTPGEPRWTIVTMHHPIHKVMEMPIDVTVFGRKRTINTIHDLKIDLVLTGHVHHASLTTVGDPQHQTVYLSASTALSSRRRGQENGFNVIDINRERMSIATHVLKEGRFKETMTYEHKRLA